ncbi:hypothetical protein DV735_g112, partial [Chaetothyriales sp. CBS 134920]
MADAKSPESSPKAAPARLTRHALFELGLEDMRRRGEPTEGMSQRAPTVSHPSWNTEAASAHVQALIAANAFVTFSDSEISRKRRADEVWMKPLRDERERELEELRMGFGGPPIPMPYGNGIVRAQSGNGRSSRSSATGPALSPPSYPTSGRSSAQSSVACVKQCLPWKPQKVSSDFDQRLSYGACGGSTWRHSTELRLLQEEMIEEAKFRPELFRTFDMKAFSAESDTKVEEDEPSCTGAPANFPPHRTIDGLAELGTYLASSSYIVSLGGPPLPDLKYGIIVVPAGEEALLFTGYGDHAAMPTELKDQIYTKSKAAQREQEMELRQQMLDELANGVGSEPEIDDDDRAFYRRRWRERNGLPTDSIDDMDVAQPDTNAVASQSAHEPGDSDPAHLMQGNHAPVSSKVEQVGGVPEPETDKESEIHDHDRPFYRRKRQKRNGLPTDSIGDMDVAQPDRNPVRSQSAHTPGDGDPARLLQSPSPESSKEGQVVSVPEPENKKDRPFDGNDPPTDSIDDIDVAHPDRDATRSQSAHGSGDGDPALSMLGDAPASPEAEPAPGIRAPTALIDGSTSIRGVQEQYLEPHVTSAGGEILQEQSGARRSTEVPADADALVGTRKVDGQARPVTLTDTTVRNSAQDMALSSDARDGLERLLGGRGRKRKRRHRVLDSLLKKRPDRIVARRTVLLEVARAATSLASGELCTNPGIDQGLWETVQADLALKTTP